MLKVGLTGGIGSGKSVVSGLLVARGAVLVDADLISRAVLAKGSPGLAQVVASFGEQVLTAQAELDRPVLGQIVFGNPELLARLNAITHPLVAEESARQVAAAQVAGAQVLVADVPLLVENHLQGLYDAVLVVSASPQTQLERLTRLRAMSRADAQARIDAQAPLAEKLAVATHVIDNDGTMEALVSQVDAVWAALLAATGRTVGPPT